MGIALIPTPRLFHLIDPEIKMNGKGPHGRFRSEDGASAVEYGLLVALIAGVIIAAVFALGQVLHTSYSGTCQTMENTAPMANSADCDG